MEKYWKKLLAERKKKVAMAEALGLNNNGTTWKLKDEIRAIELALEAAAEGKRRHTCCREGCDKKESDDDGVGKFKKCSRCNVARYCSTECAAAAWKEGHKYTCTKS